MSVSVVLACVGAGISVFGIIQYLRGIMFGGTRPRMASWIAWLTANGIFTIIALQEGSWIAVAINSVSVITNILVIGASMKRRVSLRPDDAIDWSCLIASVTCVAVIIMIPENKLLVALLAMAANIIATTPTIRHAWSKPREEAWQLFAANVFANSLGVVGIILVSGVELIAVAGPLIATLGNLGLVMVTVGRGWIVATEKELAKDLNIIEEDLSLVEE